MTELNSGCFGVACAGGFFSLSLARQNNFGDPSHALVKRLWDVGMERSKAGTEVTHECREAAGAIHPGVERISTFYGLFCFQREIFHAENEDPHPCELVVI